jgi:SPP1 family phage portal protein
MPQITETQRVTMLVEMAAKAGMTLPEIIKAEIDGWLASDTYALMLDAESYFRNRSDVQNKLGGSTGDSNVKIEHPVLKKLIDQKTNYLLARDWTVSSDDTRYADMLNDVFDDRIRRGVKSLGREAIKKGIAWMQVYFDDGAFAVKRLPSEQVIPLWVDDEHTKLDGIIRFYPQIVYDGRSKTTIRRIEYWDSTGVHYYVQRDLSTVPVPDVEMGTASAHFRIGDADWNWNTPPFVWAKYNEEELPLLYFIREIIDDVNWQTSITSDVLRDVAKFIYVLRGYEGQSLDTFLTELRKYKAIKLASEKDLNSGIDKLVADLDIDAVVKLLEIHRRNLYDYARSVDMQDEKLGDASGQALKFRYSDLDMDMNDLEMELKGSFARIKVFVDGYLQATGAGDFSGKEFEVTFSRDIITNETEAIENVKSSKGLVSEDTLLANHPWVKDVEAERERMAEDKKAAMEEYGAGMFDMTVNVPQAAAQQGKPPGTSNGDT